MCILYCLKSQTKQKKNKKKKKHLFFTLDYFRIKHKNSKAMSILRTSFYKNYQINSHKINYQSILTNC